MTENQNLPQKEPFLNTAGIEDAKSLKTSRTLLIAGAILCPASLFLPGGVFLSAAGLTCSIICLVKLVKIARNQGNFQTTARSMKTMAIVCLVACAIALILNIAAIIIMFPIVLNAVETGDYSALGYDGNPFDPSSGSNGNGGSKGSSTWG